MSLLLNTGAMHYRENVNDEWKPLVIKANADLTVLADEYSNASTYVVGEYCRYDGQLYRCTTAITTAESWTPAHWTETNIGDELKSIKDVYLPMTAGASKPLTGSLFVQNSPIYIKNTSADVSAQSDTTNRSWNIICSDKNDVASGVFDSYFRGSDGYVYAEMQGRRLVNGDTITNYLRLGVQVDGTRQVSVSNGAIWREALGLGTSGALPITIAQGGTGQTAVQYDNTAANLFTPASGVTLIGVSAALWGKVMSINIAAKKTTAVTTASDFVLGTVAAGKRPRIPSNIGVSGGNITTGNIDANGNVNLHGTVAANGNLYVFATYVIW